MSSDASLDEIVRLLSSLKYLVYFMYAFFGVYVAIELLVFIYRKRKNGKKIVPAFPTKQKDDKKEDEKSKSKKKDTSKFDTKVKLDPKKTSKTSESKISKNKTSKVGSKIREMKSWISSRVSDSSKNRNNGIREYNFGMDIPLNTSIKKNTSNSDDFSSKKNFKPGSIQRSSVTDSSKKSVTSINSGYTSDSSVAKNPVLSATPNQNFSNGETAAPGPPPQSAPENAPVNIPAPVSGLDGHTPGAPASPASLGPLKP